MTNSIKIPPVLIDCDGVCSDFLGGLFGALDYKGPPLTTWNFTAVLSPEQQIETEKILNTYQFWASLEPIPGAKPAISYFKSLGFPIHWVTSPWHTCPNWGQARRTWLHKHFGATPHDITITHRKDLVRGLTLIDDKPSHVKAWQQANPQKPVLLYAQSYNADTPESDYTYRKDWSELPVLFSLYAIAYLDQGSNPLTPKPKPEPKDPTP